MDKLWAPWRIKYIKAKQSKKCIFCDSLRHERNNYVILKTKYSTAILNTFPYNNGHIMVSPRRHVKDLTLLEEIEALDLIRTLNESKKLLDKVLKPDGYNIGINVSRAAGAGIVGHLHVHIVPRWVGDSNFMPVVHDTKIISQSLDELYKQLKNAKSKTD